MAWTVVAQTSNTFQTTLNPSYGLLLYNDYTYSDKLNTYDYRIGGPDLNGLAWIKELPNNISTWIKGATPS